MPQTCALNQRQINTARPHQPPPCPTYPYAEPPRDQRLYGFRLVAGSAGLGRALSVAGSPGFALTPALTCGFQHSRIQYVGFMQRHINTIQKRPGGAVNTPGPADTIGGCRHG